MEPFSYVVATGLKHVHVETLWILENKTYFFQGVGDKIFFGSQTGGKAPPDKKKIGHLATIMTTVLPS